MRFARTSTAVFVAPLALLLLSALPAQAQVKIAIANPVKIFNEIQETKDLRAKMEADAKAADSERIQKQSHLNDTKNSRDVYNPNTQKFQELNQKYLEEAIAFDTWGKIRSVQLANDQKQKIAYLYQKIMDGIGKVATNKKIDLVLADQAPQLPDNLDQITADQLRAVLGSRNILFAAGATDISTDIITQMDADYKAPKP